MARRMKVSDNMTKIDTMCIEQGISRTELAERSGVPRRTLENWSMRTRLPRDVYQLYKVAQALGCSIEDIMEPEPPEDVQPEAPAPEREDELLQYLQWLEDNDHQNFYCHQLSEEELDPLSRVGTDGGLEETLFRFLSRQASSSRLRS